LLNVFKSGSNHQYKTANIIKLDRTQIPFKYRRITNEDVQDINILKGLKFSAEEFVIATLDQFEFDLNPLYVNIDDVRYKIFDHYKEDINNTQGMFRKNGQLLTYIRIGK
jgi:hypothetical protein